MKIDQIRAEATMQRLGMQGNILNQQLQDIKEKAFIEKQNLEIKHPGWNAFNDVRLLTLGKFINNCEITQFSLHILGKLLDDDWYESNLTHETQKKTDYKLILTIEWEKATKYRFGTSLFTLIETTFRIILRNLDPFACNGATATFQSIYLHLLGPNQLKFSNSDREAAEELLNFVRIIRNLVHNDGVYFDEKGKDIQITYLGSPYYFNHGQPVTFITWTILLVLADEIQKLIIKVLTNPKVEILATLEDPTMKYFT